MSGLEIRSKKLKFYDQLPGVVHITAKQVIKWSFPVAVQTKTAAIRFCFLISENEVVILPPKWRPKTAANVSKYTQPYCVLRLLTNTIKFLSRIWFVDAEKTDAVKSTCKERELFTFVSLICQYDRYFVFSS